MIVALMLALLPPKPLDASAWNTFQKCMAGPGVGCRGESTYRPEIVDCEQEAGGPVACTSGWDYRREPVWTCRVHPRCLEYFDLDKDGDVDLADWALIRLRKSLLDAAATAALEAKAAAERSSARYVRQLLDALNAMLGPERRQ